MTRTLSLPAQRSDVPIKGVGSGACRRGSGKSRGGRWEGGSSIAAMRKELAWTAAVGMTNPVCGPALTGAVNKQQALITPNKRIAVVWA
jgi:hypothetical protein